AGGGLEAELRGDEALGAAVHEGDRQRSLLHQDVAVDLAVLGADGHDDLVDGRVDELPDRLLQDGPAADRLQQLVAPESRALPGARDDRRDPLAVVHLYLLVSGASPEDDRPSCRTTARRDRTAARRGAVSACSPRTRGYRPTPPRRS